MRFGADAILDAGAVVGNIEDSDQAGGHGLLGAAGLSEIRTAGDQRGVRIVLNARIDATIRHPQRDAAAALDEVIHRARLYLDAGADCVSPIGLREPALVARTAAGRRNGVRLDRPRP